MVQLVPTSQQLAWQFNRTFNRSHRVLCLGAAQDPSYDPGTPGGYAILRYRQDFAASVLHEVAHWCLASGEQRQLVDLGLHYIPPPRCSQAREVFFKSELPVQALESVFAAAAGLMFQVSADDLSCPAQELVQFAEDVACCANNTPQAEWPDVAREYLDVLRVTREFSRQS